MRQLLQTLMHPADLLDPQRHMEIRTPNVLVGIPGLFWRLNGPDGRPLARAVHCTVAGEAPIGWLVRRDGGAVLLSGGSESEATAVLIRIAIAAALGPEGKA